MSCIRRNEDTTAVHKKTTTNSLLINSNFSLYECIMYLDCMRCMLSSKKKINNRLVAGNKNRNKGIGSMLSSINCISFLFKWKSEHSASCGKQSITPRVENRATSCGQNPSFHYKWKTEHSTSCGKQDVHLVWTKIPLPTLCGNSFLFHQI